MMMMMMMILIMWIESVSDGMVHGRCWVVTRPTDDGMDRASRHHTRGAANKTSDAHPRWTRNEIDPSRRSFERTNGTGW